MAEKGFHRIKHSLGPDRIRMHGRAMSGANDQARVHSQQAMGSKVFIGFIALIRTMGKLRTQVVDDRRLLFPMTKRQQESYQVFSVAPPV